MTMPMILALNRHWKTTPPTHISLARLNSALLKQKDAPTPAPQAEHKEERGSLQELLSYFGKAGGQIKS